MHHRSGPDIDDGDTVASLRRVATVVARERELSVVGHSQLMGVLPGGRNAADDLAVCRIDDGHVVFAFMQDEQRG